MGLLDEIHQASGHKRTCRLAEVRKDLSAADQRDLDIAIAGTASARAIVSALRARGLSIGETALHKHRGGRCVCAR